MKTFIYISLFLLWCLLVIYWTIIAPSETLAAIIAAMLFLTSYCAFEAMYFMFKRMRRTVEGGDIMY